MTLAWRRSLAVGALPGMQLSGPCLLAVRGASAAFRRLSSRWRDASDTCSHAARRLQGVKFRPERRKPETLTEG